MMFDRFLKDPHALERQQSGPLAAERRRYLEHCAGQQLSWETLRGTASYILVIAQELHLAERPDAFITLAEIEAAADRWIHRPRPRRKDRRIPTFTGHAVRWLTFLGRLQRPAAIQPYAADIAQFAEYQLRERGLARQTVEHCRPIPASNSGTTPARRIIMRDTSLLAPWIRRFLMEHLIHERNLARNTQRSYRDTLQLLLPAIARRVRKPIDRLTVTDLSADRVRLFLTDLEEQRGCATATRNQRLAAIHALARFIGKYAPELLEWSGQVRAVPFKRAPCVQITYLEKPEMDALLAAPDMATTQGRRDHAMLLFLYNTGTRADEAAQVRIGDLTLPHVPDRDMASVLIRGKGNKTRRCPLWAQTVRELATLVEGRGAAEHVFLNRCGRAITRFGIHTLIERTVARAMKQVPSLATKRVSPHTIRHTTATHLLRSGVDINTIRAWLGHASLTTTNVYAEVDLEMKAKALANCEVGPKKKQRTPWKEDKGLMEFLRTL